MSDPIFISYSKKDSDFAYKLADDLSRVGFKIWIDRSIGGGEKWRETIESNLKVSREVIIIVSPNSMVSDWVRHEGSLAYGWGKKLYPILIAPVQSLPPWLEEYQWVSFVNTPHNLAFDTLVGALTPSNPVQNLLDERVKVYRQTGELFGQEMIAVIEKGSNALTISPEAEEIFQKSRQAIEARHQKESEQEHVLAEAAKKQSVTEKRSQRMTLFLITSFVLAALISILSISPVSTGWHRLHSFDPVKGKSAAKYFVTMNNSDAETIFISDYTPGGFYKSAFNTKECWSKIESLPITDTVVTYIAASENIIFVITSNGLFASDDEGANWKSLQLVTEHEELEPTAIVINPLDPLQVFVGTTPAALFVSENGGREWQSVNLPRLDGSGVQALGQNGIDLLLASGQSIWASRDNAKSWTMLLDGVSPIYGLSMIGDQGRFFIARGEQGIADADVNSTELRVLSDAPNSTFVQSVSASNAARFVTDKEGVWYWRLWPWTNFNWLLARLGISIPCY
jgi:hypothetical protein